MSRVHVEIPSPLLTALDTKVDAARTVDPFTSRASYIRAVLREHLSIASPALDIPSDLLAIFSELAGSKGETLGTLLTEAVRRFVVEEARGGRRRGRHG